MNRCPKCGKHDPMVQLLWGPRGIIGVLCFYCYERFIFPEEIN